MSNPITWQNVNPTAADPTRTMDSASRMFADMFSGLKGTLKEADEGNKLANTNAIRQALYGAKTPEQLAALEGPNGQLAQLYAASGGNYDPAVQALQDGRADVLRQQGTNAINYGNTTADAAAAPILEQYKQLMLKGDKLGAATLMAANPGIRGGSGALDFGQVVERRNVANTQADARYGWDQAAEVQKATTRPLEVEKLKSALLTDQAQRVSAYAQADNATSNAATNRINSQISQAKLDEQIATTASLKAAASRDAQLDGNQYKEGLLGNSAKDTTDLWSVIAGAKGDFKTGPLANSLTNESGKAADLFAKVNEVAREGIKVSTTGKDPVTGKDRTDVGTVIPSKAAIYQALSQTTDGTIWDDPVVAFQKAIDKAVKATDGNGRNIALDQFKMYQSIKQKAVEEPVVTGVKPPKPKK